MVYFASFGILHPIGIYDIWPIISLLNRKKEVETYSTLKNHYHATLFYWCCLFLCQLAGFRFINSIGEIKGLRLGSSSGFLNRSGL